MDLSISIVSYNTKENLRECLNSVFAHLKETNCEIIVVDNGSLDGSPEMVRQIFPTVHLIENKKNVFFAKAHNQAMKASSGKYILLLNSDVLMTENAVNDMIDFLEQNPGAGAVSGTILYPDGRVQTTGWNLHTPVDEILNQEPWKTLFRKKYLSRARLKSFSSPKEVDIVSDAFLMARRQALFQIGLYDERFLLYYTEDDLCTRLRHTGWKIYHLPQISVVHKLFGSSRKVAPLKIALIGALDTLRYCGKYYGVPCTIGITFFLSFGLFLETVRQITKGLIRF
jgi:GT2 family glycosyltransferase